ncbi:hypothetical protein F0562_035021 [Nyssa sinensis]|uniref:non-specific serine/threonine protein kinase n=1 Tax=Nyssa sinensis TaxID=561372 RepID=A0A5J5AC32_9ASTE|nr:hypothetical protein F0562_035021 [Nyssa sinensis]
MEKTSPELDLDNLRAIKVLGKGAMGTVFLVHDRSADPFARCPFALKVVEKSSLHTKLDADRRARWEVSVLARLTNPTHPFLPTLIGSFNTQEFLGWAVPYCPGGDLNVLRYHQTDHVFSPSVIRFYLAEIVCALEHLHSMGIVYRDLKPENILIQQSGHVTLTDFDLSRSLTPRTMKTFMSSEPIEVDPPEVRRRHRRNLTRFIPVVVGEKKGLKKAKSARVSPVSRRKPSFTSGERSNSFVGTDEYVSPEMVRGDGHEFAVDWWALGILMYEMMYGKTPFRGKNRKETFRNVLMKRPEFIGVRTALNDLIERLLEKDPRRRLGYNRGASEIKEHEFFRGLKWDLLTEVLRPPFLPSREEGDSTEKSTDVGFDIREYFKKLTAQQSVPPSPLSSPSLKDSRYNEVLIFTWGQLGFYINMARKYRTESSSDDDGRRHRHGHKKSSRSNGRRERRIEDGSDSSGSDEGEIRDRDNKNRSERRKESSGSSDEDDRRVGRERGTRDRERTDRRENGHGRREKDDDYRGREDDRGGHKKSERQMDRTRDDERDRRRRSGQDDRDENEHKRREAEENYRAKDRRSRRDSDDDDDDGDRRKRLERQRDRTGGDVDRNRKKTDGNGRYRIDKEENERREESKNSREEERVEKVNKDLKSQKQSAPQDGNLNMEAANLGRSGGIYIPPFKLARMMKDVQDKSSAEYQRMTWDALRKSINGLVNKVNATNIKNIIPELFAENLIRGRGLFCRSCMKSQMASPSFTDVFAALVSVVNTKFPEVGDLLLRRIVLQLRRAYKRNDKPQLLAAVKFIAHLVNQQVVHELIALELLTLLLDKPTDDSVEVAVGFVTECGSILQDLCPRGLHGIFERFRGILHEGEIDKRVQFLIEGLFAIRKAKFQGYPAVRPELDLVDQEDQLTHEISLQEEIDPEIALDVFKLDPQFLENEKRYEELKKTILGDESEDEADSDAGSDEDDDEDDEDDEEEEEEKMKIKDETETNLVNLRRTIYLTIMSSVDFEEAGHKLLKIKLEPGQEMELCIMLLECCSQERTYLRYYGLLGQRFCMINKVHQENFEKCFVQQYSMIHRLETNKLRNVAKFFAHLLGTDALPWHVLAYIRLTEEDTTSSSRIFIKILFQELSEHLGIRMLNERLNDPTMQDSFESIFPKDNPKNTRFSINFFTSIGLGGITENLREYLKNMPRLIMQQQKPVPESESDEQSGSSGSSASDASSSESESESSSSDSSESDDRHKKRRRRN